MGFFESINDKVHDLIRGIKKWGSSEARGVEDTQQQKEIPAPVLRNMDRGILNRGVIERAPDYEKVSHSPSVKSLIRNISDYEAVMTRMRIPQRQNGEDADQKFMNEMAQVNGEVFTCMQKMQEYLVRKAQGYTQKGERYRGVMGVCASAATNIRTQMDLVNKIQENCFYALRKGLGVPYGESYVNLLQNVNYFQETDNTESTLLGQGGINSVYLVQDTERGTDRVLKEGHMDVTMSNAAEESVYERIRMQRTEGGKKHTMNTAHRDVAVSMIDKLFNLNAVVDTSMARTKSGNQASLMDKAEGKEVNKTYTYMNDKGEKRAGLLQQITLNRVYLQKGLDYTFKNQKEYEDEMRNRMETKERKFVNINSSQFLESTYNLAALDIIVGHVDRHAGNMMMTEAGVKGIDNDSAFSLRKAGHKLDGETKNMTAAQFRSITQQRNAEGENMEVMNAQSQAALFFDKTFPVVTEEFRNKILDVPLSAVEGILKGLVAGDEVKACVDRVAALQKYLRELPDNKVVESYDQIDINKYAGERQITMGNGTYTNIMSHIRGVGKEVEFDYNMEEFKEAANLMGGSNEITIMRDYIMRTTGAAKSEALPIAFQLMKLMAREAENDGFNVYEALRNGKMNELCKMAMNEVMWEQERDNLQNA